VRSFPSPTPKRKSKQKKNRHKLFFFSRRFLRVSISNEAAFQQQMRHAPTTGAGSAKSPLSRDQKHKLLSLREIEEFDRKVKNR
jgi:hypothetical protein